MFHFKTLLLSTCLVSFTIVQPFKDTVGLKNSYFKISADTKLAPNFYTTQTGFFCNQERALEKKTKMAIKFRLGSLEHTQKLEGYSLSRGNN
jgi:hypothetical protein